MSKKVLVVDDEKNIRLTLISALRSMQNMCAEAVSNGEEALEKVEEEDFDVILLDLRLPGIQGMELLRRIASVRPDIKVIIITAYGTVESAVEAMKLGAVDYIQKPFSPDEIRELILKVLRRDKLSEDEAVDYDTKLELVKKSIQSGHFDAAIEHANAAVAQDLSRPEAHNLLGAVLEMKDDADGARREYRMAISVDPSYEPARKNLNRLVGWEPEEKMHLGNETGEAFDKEE